MVDLGKPPLSGGQRPQLTGSPDLFLREMQRTREALKFSPCQTMRCCGLFRSSNYYRGRASSSRWIK